MASLQRLSPALLALSLIAAPARASLGYPEEIQEQLDLPELPSKAPGCTLCHRTEDGGIKTVTTPFGRSMVTSGALGGSIQSLRAALDSADKAGTDSDRDGTSDVDELRAGSDPNLALGELPQDPVPLPETGCALSVSGRVKSPWAWTPTLLLVLVALRRRR